MNSIGNRLIVHGAAALLVSVTACADNPQSPQPPAQLLQPGAPSLTRSPQGGDVSETYVEVKRNGKTKLYRVKINKGRRSIEFETVAEEGTFTTSSAGSTCDDPDMPGCESNPEEPGGGSTGGTYMIQTGELDIEGEVHDTVDTGEQWDPSYSEAGWDGTRWHCPRRIDDVHFNWKGHYFETEGESYFVGQVPSSTAGVVKGRFLLPNGPWLSKDGKARIWSGTVDANCYFQYTVAFGILLVEYGYIAVYKFNGDYEEFSNNVHFASNAGGEYGGPVYRSLEELRIADPEAYGVVKAWLDTATCTAGWVIIVDGERVC